MSDKSSATYRRSDAVDASRVGERTVLYHRNSGKSLVLNPTGARIWELLEDKHHVAELVACLCHDHASLSEEQATSDVISYLRDLSDHDAITTTPQ